MKLVVTKLRVTLAARHKHVPYEKLLEDANVPKRRLYGASRGVYLILILYFLMVRYSDAGE